ncbi:MAG: clostripain [Selenomonadaceae bacterium]|nr:clostripain [Selenomonadaceae bacterium]
MQKFYRTFQRFFLLTAFLLVAFTTAACDGDDVQKSSSTGGTSTKSPTASFEDTYASGDTWVIQWYLCGADLETNYGSATTDLQEVLAAKLPPNVKFIIETGGAQQWQNDTVNSNAIERYLYDSNGLQRLETLSDADMGDVNTLTDFVRYGQQYPADHRIFIFWDHGGGSVGGICIDERASHALSLNDLTQAFGSVYGADTNNPPFEIIGFDACLMATYDTINALDGFTRYVVASEETEPSLGGNYTAWLTALANNPATGGAKLGKEICDSYFSACAEYDIEDKVTLSVIDMSKLPELRHAYEMYGLEALVESYKNPKGFFSKFGRGATSAENYGGNNKSDGYTNMVDLADLARNNKSLIPATSDRLIAAIDNAVIYRVHGDYRDKGDGLSGFHLYNAKTNEGEMYLSRYINLNSAPDPQKLLYYHLKYGELPEEIKPTLQQLVDDPNAFTTPEPPPAPVETAPVTTPPAQTQNLFDVSSLEDTPVDIDNEGNSFVTLNQEQMDLISSVHCELMYVSTQDDIILLLGSDADINADWETGVFKDNFRGVWPMLDGHPVYVEIVAENDGYNLYSIPIKLNGVECNLQVAYVYAAEQYYILGAKKGLDSNGMSDRELIKLRPGDEITTLHYAMSISGDDTDPTQVEVDTFTIGEHPTVKDEQLGDGSYGYFFEFVAPTEESSLSNLVTFTIANGEITTTVNN